VVVCRNPFNRACFSNPFLILRSDFFTGDNKKVSSISVYVMAKRIMIGDNYTIKPFLSGSFTYIAYTSTTIAGVGMKVDTASQRC